MGLKTENNIPNAKVIAGMIVGYAIPLYLALAPGLGLPVFDAAWASQHVEAIIAGVVSVILVVQYFKAPRKGDGVKEKT